MRTYKNCVLNPTISCFTERSRSWTRLPSFNVDRANEACALFLGQHNMASFLKLPSHTRIPENYPIRTIRNIDLVRITAGNNNPLEPQTHRFSGEPFSELPDPSFDHYNFEVVSKSFLRQQVTLH